MAEQSNKKCLAVFTSGGDSQGMNAALRAVIRIALHKGMRAFVIEEGYRGLVEGGKHIRECQWGTLSYIMQKGGTVIGTARCKEFMERAGRLKAAENLVKSGINSLVVIGGDGSLTGANVFKEEWTGLLEELIKTGRLTKEEVSRNSYLNIAGLVGSIDNDMCGTDMTIGTDSALHRILEAMDCISSTASSHQRCFIMEIMGRHCGYLALMAGIAGNADWVLVPENPPEPGWEDLMCNKLSVCRSAGKRLNVIVVAEGAIDNQNKPIKVQYVKEVIDSKLKYDTRITVLGHVQRGGKPSAYDRIIATRMGADASLALAEANGEIPPIMLATQGNRIVRLPLMECVIKTRSINQAMKDRDFEKVKKLRSSNLTRSMEALKRLEACDCSNVSSSSKKYRIAVMNVGAPAGGTNNCNRAFIRFLLYAGHEVYGIVDGFEGLVRGNAIRKMSWIEIDEWGCTGGSSLGTNRILPTDETLPKIASELEKESIQGLLVIGGFEAFESVIKLAEARSKYSSLRIPILQVAATISNNVPGTEYSLGSDTALNTIVGSTDVLKQSATASRKRVFVVETMGGYCGYLATLGALAGGADNAYIFEAPITLSDLQKDVDRLVSKFSAGNFERGIILRNECCSKNYTTEFITQMLAEEGKEYFVTRNNVLGHLQQGDYPSPFDRIMGTKFATESVDHLLSQIPANMNKDGTMNATSSETACILGLVGKEIKPTPIDSLLKFTDFKHRIPKEQWWMKLRPLIMVLSHHTECEFNGEEAAN